MNAPRSGSAYHATDGEAYEVFLGRWTRRLSQPLLDFARFRTNGRLLDVGCGTGSMAHAMAARWPARDIVGIDIALPYIAYARSQARPANLHFEIADAVRLPYAEASFAGAAAQLVLNFVPDPLAERNKAGDCAWRVCHRSRVGFPRRSRLPAHLLGHRCWYRCWSRHRARPAVLRSACASRWSFPTVRNCRAPPGRARFHHHSHGLREFRRLLETTLWRPGPRRDLPRRSRSDPSC